jgi:hypothetical protein
VKRHTTNYKITNLVNKLSYKQDVAKLRNKRYNTSMSRREYKTNQITVNKIFVSKVIIDSHYEEKHKDHISDELILELVKKLDGRTQTPDMIDEEFSYFTTWIEFSQKQYRLIWLIEEGEIYIGVVNAFRDKKGE